MKSKVISHIDEILGHRGEDGVTYARKIAMQIIVGAMGGDALMCKLVLDSEAMFDEVLDALDEDDLTNERTEDE